MQPDRRARKPRDASAHPTDEWPAAPTDAVSVGGGSGLATFAGERVLANGAIGIERQLVVIDAGHGGHDPGTEAAGEVAEKDLALQIAIRVRDALLADGVDARLTRDDDTFLTLAERTQLANQNRADLFVSIHLNSSPDPDTTGIETYYLNNTTDRATIRLARMENGVREAIARRASPT